MLIFAFIFTLLVILFFKLVNILFLARDYFGTDCLVKNRGRVSLESEYFIIEVYYMFDIM